MNGKVALCFLYPIRIGECDDQVRSFLNSRVSNLKDDFYGAVLFAKKSDAESYNQEKLDKLKSKLHEFKTQVVVLAGANKKRETLIAYSPLPEILFLKEGALVMIRKNDINGEYVNGSLGRVRSIKDEEVSINLWNGKTVAIQKEDFKILDGDKCVIATIRNFPLTLGWATTIHKSQGASIDALHVDISSLWEYGQAYVALSRAKDPKSLFIERWTEESIKAHPEVIRFYSQPEVNRALFV